MVRDVIIKPKVAGTLTQPGRKASPLVAHHHHVKETGKISIPTSDGENSSISWRKKERQKHGLQHPKGEEACSKEEMKSRLLKGKDRPGAKEIEIPQDKKAQTAQA